MKFKDIRGTMLYDPDAESKDAEVTIEASKLNALRAENAAFKDLVRDLFTEEGFNYTPELRARARALIGNEK